MLDDRFDDQLRDAARDYNAPPETPREEMWAAIQAKRLERAVDNEAEKAEEKEAERRKEEHQRVLPFRPVRSFRPYRLPPQPPVAVVPAPQVSDVAYRLAATEHLSQAESFLTLFRTSIRQGGNEQLASATARQLLATNRLLLDSRAASDRRTRLLLQDLELVLAQIAQLSGEPSSPDLDLIREGLEDSGVMSRLRTAVPSGTSATQGVL
ncbi:MAG: hypothetical protein K0S19_396 [Geminicoccaceae bacterium]|nr:hypothetical protein [Geminicoccaceae bacterium]